MVKNEWENHDSDFLQDLDRIYTKTREIIFLYLLVNLSK